MNVSECATAVPAGPPLSDRRPLRAVLTAPLLTLTVAVTGTVGVAVRSPEEPGHYPSCPLLATTGLWCPGCGGMRAVHALAHGDLDTAIDRNVLVVVVTPLLAVAWLYWILQRVTRRPLLWRAFPPVVAWASVGFVVAFAIVRNIPLGAWFAP